MAQHMARWHHHLQVDMLNVQSGFYLAELISGNERHTVCMVKMY